MAKMDEKLDEMTGDIDRREFLKAAGVASGAAGSLGFVWYGATRDSDDTDQPEQDPDRTNPLIPEPEPPDDPSDSQDGGDDEDPPDDDPDEDPPEAEIPHADEFETVIEAVQEGADPDGEQPVNFLFEENTDDSTLFAFGPGTYRIEPFAIQNRTQIGLTRSGEEKPKFIPAAGGCRGGHPYIFFDRVRDLLLDGIDLDFRDSESGGPIHFFLDGDSTVSDVMLRGTCSNQFGLVRIEVRDPSGSALIENFEARNVQKDNSLTGIFVSRNHAGEATFKNCQLDDFSDNGLYASAPGGPNGHDGTVKVLGGTYRNNNIANVRLGSTGSVAENVTIRVDSEPPGWGQLNTRGIRLRNKADQTIRNCEITYEESAAFSFGAVVFHAASGSGLVTDTEIRIERPEIPAVRAFSPENPDDGSPVLENVSITGAATDGVIADIEGRDETVFRNCTIEQSASNRRGIRFRNSQDCLIEGCTLEVNKEPVILDNASVSVVDSTIATAEDEQYFEDLQLANETLML